ncbi:MAG TPA: DUF6263 family protein [Chitinophagaceae bacterium]
MLKVASAILLVFSLALFQSCKPTAKPGPLKFNLKEGKEYELQTDWNIIQQLEGDTSTITMNNIYLLKVIRQQDSTATVKVTFGEMRNTMNVGGININSDTRVPFIDSTDGEFPLPSVMNHVFMGLKGKTFEMQVTGDGKVVSVNGLEQLEDAVVENAKTLKDAARVTYRELFNANAMKERMNKVFFIYPVKQVNVGDTWTKQLDVSGFLYKSVYTVKSATDNQLFLSLAGKADKPGSNATIEQAGSLVVDAESGMIINALIDQHTISMYEGKKDIMKNTITVNGSTRK